MGYKTAMSSNNIKILSIFGTRPEAIKMAPVVKALHQTPGIDSEVCVTAQHREMLDQVLRIFSITPRWDLNIMNPGQDLYDVTSRTLISLRDVLKEFNPDAVLVHGDTATTLAASIASYYAKIPVGHVEAGLRTRNIYSPWPEEINRQIAARIATWHFAPTETAKKSLLDEAVPEDSIYVTGNTVIDSLQWVSRILREDDTVRMVTEKTVEGLLGISPRNEDYILVTGHRRENFGQGFENICEALRTIAERFQNKYIVYPVHLNPNVQKPVMAILNEIKNIRLIEPVDYIPFVFLMMHSTLILTDSGGIQEEAPALGKPVIVMRDTTERPEAVKAGTVLLVGTDSRKIFAETARLITDTEHYNKMSNALNPYGDGHAGNRIVKTLKDSFNS